MTIISKVLYLLLVIFSSTDLYLTFQLYKNSLRRSLYIESLHERCDAICFSFIGRAEKIRPLNLDNEYLSNSGFIRNGAVEFRSSLFQTQKLRYLRSLYFIGSGYDVYNLITIPEIDSPLPILSIDLVKLPGTSIVSIDFQPLNGSMDALSAKTTRMLIEVSEKWRLAFKCETSMKEKYEKYFSPFAIFARFTTENENYWKYALDAITDYVTIYAEVINEHDHNISFVRADDAALREYLDFRIKNDPAKNILNVAFGKEWTEFALEKSIFPYISSQRPL